VVKASPRTRPGLKPWEGLRLFFSTIKVEHTVFALPFAYLTLLLASGGLPSLGHFLWITVAMAGARIFAMGVNRIIDARIDAANPRTATRPLASGRLRLREAWAFSLAAAALFLIAVYQLSPLAQVLWPPVLFAMATYPYGKRFTWLCHLGLGSVYLMVPPAVWVAVHNGIGAGSVLLGFAAALWVAGFDLIYACQDVEVDRRQGLHSIPARFGIATGLRVARLWHLGAVAFLAAAGPVLGVGPLYYLGVAVSAGVLAYEHRLVSPTDLSRLNAAFFNMNGVMSVVFLAFVAADVLVG
jgi:4-hydroxybenzoate polyprenyltransferase